MTSNETALELSTIQEYRLVFESTEEEQAVRQDDRGHNDIMQRSAAVYLDFHGEAGAAS